MPEYIEEVSGTDCRGLAEVAIRRKIQKLEKNKGGAATTEEVEEIREEILEEWGCSTLETDRKLPGVITDRTHTKRRGE